MFSVFITADLYNFDSKNFSNTSLNYFLWKTILWNYQNFSPVFTLNMLKILEFKEKKNHYRFPKTENSLSYRSQTVLIVLFQIYLC